VRVNLIHSKLVFQKKIIVHVNVNSASELHWFFLKKKTLFTYKQCRGRKADDSCFEFNCVLNAKLSGLYKNKLCFECYQTIIWPWLLQIRKQPRKQTNSFSVFDNVVGTK
jgi:hypothetical protein